MKTYWNKKVTALVLALGLLLCSFTGAVAQENTAADFAALQPLMDLVAATALAGGENPELVPGSDGSLSEAFVTAFFQLGQTADASLGITADMLGDTQRQAEYLSKVFAAQAPALAPIPQGEGINGFVGFLPQTVNSAEGENGIQIIGELYWAEQPIQSLSQAEYDKVQWLDERAIYSFQKDAGALNGFRLTGFSVGSELNMEMAMQGYFDEILVEYVNTRLGFSVQYPSLFDDELLVEDEDGLSAKLADGSASFFAKRVDNVSNAELHDYLNVIADAIPGAKAQINDEFRYGTVAYTTEDGSSVFDIYVVTDKYIYQTELSYQASLADRFALYCAYLENTFMVDEVSVG